MAAVKKLLPDAGEAPGSPDEDRGSERYRLHFPVATEHAEAGAVSATVHNLSNTGMLLETSAPLPLGSRLVVELPAVGTILTEIVRRQEDDRYGCEFRSLVPDSAVREALRQSPIAWLKPEGGNAADRSQDRASPQPPLPVGIEGEPTVRWPLARRLAFIALTSALLWGGILLAWFALT